MAIEKILQKIKVQIAELSDTMEGFVEDTIHPSAEDCEKLRRQMNDLLECVAVYKYYKLNNEISPSFNIHAKISEKVPVETTQNTEPVKPPPPAARPDKAQGNLQIGINDKFRFINELFSQNNSEYNIVMEQLNNLSTWQETDLYLSSLKNVYGWKDSNEVVKYFYSQVKKRFQ